MSADLRAEVRIRDGHATRAECRSKGFGLPGGRLRQASRTPTKAASAISAGNRVQSEQQNQDSRQALVCRFPFPVGPLPH